MSASSKNLGDPDESISFPGVTEDLVEIGDLTVGRTTQQPGWRWSTHVKPLVGGDWCEARHVGVVLSGRFGVELRDGTTAEFRPGDVYEIPPGHDGYTIGDEPAQMIEWAGLRTFARRHLGFQGRTLATILFTDLVGSTEAAVQLGDVAWREKLASHFQTIRSRLDRFGGREIETTGDGFLATFDGPAAALRCAADIREAALRHALRVRIGVHVGEIEVTSKGIRGVSVHETARVMGVAEADEILVSETTRVLAAASGLSFEDRGVHELKGFPAPVRLFAYVEHTDDQDPGPQRS